MTAICKALTRATYKAAHSAIRAAKDTQAAWSATMDGMPYQARSAAVESYLCKANARPATNISDRLYNHKMHKLIGI